MQDRSVCPRPVAPATNHHWMVGAPRNHMNGELLEGYALADEKCKFCGEERTIRITTFDDSDWWGINDPEHHARLKKSVHESGYKPHV